MQGYIKDHRKELSSDIWIMPPLYHRVWQWLKYQVNHNDAEIPMQDGTKLRIKKGQHLTSLRKIARGIGWYERGIWQEPNPKTITAILKWLSSNHMITISKGLKNRQYTLITILNWEVYQVTEEQGTGPPPPEAKVPKEPKQKQVKYPEDNTYYKMAVYFYKKVSAVAKDEGLSHQIIKVDMQKWADDMRKLVEINKMDKRLVKDVMDWVTEDDFWKTNVLSAKKLREKFGDLALKMKATINKQPILQQQRADPRDKEIEFQRWIEKGGDPNKFDWGK